MSYTNRAIMVLSLITATCFAFSFYLSKYHKEPIAIIQLDKGGCFGHSSYKLSLLHKNKSIIARLDSGSRIIMETPLSKSQMDTFDVFVNELKKIREDGGCSNYQIY